jgi:hypothetical protein
LVSTDQTITYLNTTTRHGAHLLIRSYENGHGAIVYISGERVGSVDRGSWEGHAPLLYAHRYEPLPTLKDAVAFIARECGAPDRPAFLSIPETGLRADR